MNNEVWNDEDVCKPPKDGQYLCLVKWYSEGKYNYELIDYSSVGGWHVTGSCVHILWTELPSKPNMSGFE